MRTLRITAIALALAMLPGAVHSLEQKTTVQATGAIAAPKPAPEMAQLKYLLGTWRCEGTDFPSLLGPQHRIQRVITTRMDFDGFWLTMRWEEKATKENPYPWKGVHAFTYDPEQKRFVNIFNDNTGMWSTGTSDGWDGDKLVVVGEYTSGGQKAAFRDTYIKKSDKAHEFIGEIKVNEQWSKDTEATCQK